uniref:Uncharacterized protein n=1 Tax=Anguilla anguilla TaxID=7936 RepID=A0A0E9WA34_ANGAN
MYVCIMLHLALSHHWTQKDEYPTKNKFYFY